MEIYQKVEAVKTKEDIIKFIMYLREDLHEKKSEWENPTLEAFLESMEAWISDNENLPLNPSWKTFADILYASKIYEYNMDSIKKGVA
jgi:hypothetical protein